MRLHVSWDRIPNMMIVAPRDEATRTFLLTTPGAGQLLDSILKAHRSERAAEDPPAGARVPHGVVTPGRIAAELRMQLRITYPNAEIEVSHG